MKRTSARYGLVHTKKIETFTKEEIQAMNATYVGVTGTIDAYSLGPAYEYNCENGQDREYKGCGNGGSDTHNGNRNDCNSCNLIS